MRTYVHVLSRFARQLTLAMTAAVVPASVAAAQSADAPVGRITGRIIDAKSGQGIAAAGVQVVGTTIGAQSGVDGRYTIIRVPAGTTTLQVRRIGYGPKTVTGVIVPANGALELDISLNSADVQLAAISVTATKEKGTVNDALNLQRTATNAVNSITAEQIARSPDGDAAQAAQRVSGVTVQDGKFLQVRGLSERYTTASLNGARIPSPEPERKVVPLDLFPANLLQDVTTTKTFTPDQPGDFAGANVNIRTKEFPASRQINYSTSFGANSRVLGQTLPFAPRAGGELVGFANSKRQIPNAIAQANFLGNVSQGQFNQMAQQQRNVWNPTPRNGGPNGSFGASTGGNTILGKRIGYVLSGSYGYSEEVRADEQFAVGNQGANNTVVPLTSVSGSTGRSSAQWGGIANLSTLVGKSSRLSLNTTMTRSADNEARMDRGFDENLGDSIARTTLRYVERGVATVTGAGEHQLGERNKTAWAVTYANTGRREPDRSDVVYARNNTGQYTLLSSLDGARRLYFDLAETNNTAQIDHTITIGEVANQNTLKVGAYARSTDRRADAPIYAFLSRAADNVRSQQPDVIFGAAQACSNCSFINVQPVGQAGSYTAEDRTMAGYLMADWGLGSRVRIIAGARVESADITVDASTQGGFTSSANLNNTDVLPSLLVNTKLTETQNLRFGITRTLARPEYRELAPVTFRDVLGGVSVTGNDQLRRSLIDNVDLRYEAFPNPGEVLSIGVFAKRFDSPIERIEQATSGAYQARFQNALSAVNAGVELEFRKQLGFLGGWAEPLTGFSNVTLMSSSVDLDTLGGLTVTDRTRRLVGQAPYVVNAGMTYSSLSGRTNATILYNVVGERIQAAGVVPLPNIVEKPRHMVDLSLRFPVAGSLSARMDARNLLDARYRFMQGNLEREGYNAGRSFSVGLSWRQ
ncbi:carboxypeptidase regulatory-like domain-containing protein [Gemmatimonas sp.]|jgi:TonB-dependent receptor|uniref:TonB-dependent receptor n=1 Tax=Gemmatimonas sp. TaxID=1962908 RepID=UPI0037BF96A4